MKTQLLLLLLTVLLGGGVVIHTVQSGRKYQFFTGADGAILWRCDSTTGKTWITAANGSWREIDEPHVPDWATNTAASFLDSSNK
jgi:hypothetical protein